MAALIQHAGSALHPLDGLPAKAEVGSFDTGREAWCFTIPSLTRIGKQCQTW
jgi:hypothetical protein